MIAVIVAANWILPGWSGRPGAARAFGPGTVAAWIVTVAGLTILLALVGSALQQRPSGVLIDNRNRISLSKFQVVGWTVLVLSGVISVAATMLGGLPGRPDAIAVPNTLLTLMGISMFTAAATPAILGLKTAPTASHPEAGNARWTDLVRGDDTSNARSPDISKIQQLLMTLIVMAVYVFRLCTILRHGIPNDTGALEVRVPDLGDDLVWLVGISHAGYLSYKAVPHSDRDAAATAAEGAPPRTLSAADGALG